MAAGGAALAFMLAACAEAATAPRTGPGIRLAAADGDTAAAEGAAVAMPSAAPLQIGASGEYLAGLVASNQHDLSAAADFMLLTLEQDPDNVELLQGTFMLVAADGRHVEAVRLAHRVVQDSPIYSAANLVLAIDAMARDDAAGALEATDRLTDRGLDSIMRPLLRGWLLAGSGDLDGALTALAPLQENRGFAVLHQLHVALMNDQAGRAEAAEAAYLAAMESAAKPSLRLSWLIGNFFERQGQPERARAVYEGYLAEQDDSSIFEIPLARLDGGAPPPPPAVQGYKQGVAEMLFNLASLLSQERAERMALVHIHLALRLDPEFEVARVLLGEILQSQDRGPKAIEVYRHIDPASPFAATARLRIAEELERLERYEEAVAELEGLARERPHDFEPLFRLGNLLRGEERFAEAVTAYDRAFERLGEPHPRHWTLYYFRGIALERSGQWDRAEPDFLKALELEPEQPYVMNYLAYSWIEQENNLEEAQGMLARAVDLRPTDGYIVDSLGWVFYRLNQYDKAVQYLEQAIELRPQDPVINDHLGDAYWQVGRRQEARFQWRRSLSLDPEPNLIPDIETKIKKGLPRKGNNI